MKIVTFIASLALVSALPAAGADAPVLVGQLRDGGLVGLSASGAIVATFAGVAAPGTSGASFPAWSPDGTQVAFSKGGIWVAGLDGASRQLTAPVANGFDFMPTWSPDGSQVAFIRYDSSGDRDIYVVGVKDGALRRLTSSGGSKDAPSWQPHGTLVLYRSFTTVPGGQLFLADTVTGTIRRLLADGAVAGSWSPDGKNVAYASAAGLGVASVDGGEQRILVRRPVEDPTWSPDGRRIAFLIRTSFPEYYGRGGTPSRTDVYTVGAEGSDLRRLTGFDGDLPWTTPIAGASAPRWWSGGDRLFFAPYEPGSTTGPRAWSMNADGSCQAAFARPTPLFGVPSWSPTAAPVPPSECSSAQLRLRAGRTEVGLHDDVPLKLILRNAGTRPLEGARLTIEATRGAVRSADQASPVCADGHTLVCSLGSVPRGAELALEFLGTPGSTVGNAEYTARISWQGEPDVNTAADVATVGATVAPCDIVGTWGNDKLIGTARRDRICGRPGADRIEGGAGNDRIEAGSGADTVVGGKGRDTIDAGGGGDVVYVRDGERDVVDCGTEQDIVVADQRDVLKHCEHVTRARVRR